MSRHLSAARKTIRREVELQLREADALGPDEIERCFEYVTEDAGPALDLDRLLDPAPAHARNPRPDVQNESREENILQSAPKATGEAMTTDQLLFDRAAASPASRSTDATEPAGRLPRRRNAGRTGRRHSFRRSAARGRSTRCRLPSLSGADRGDRASRRAHGRVPERAMCQRGGDAPSTGSYPQPPLPPPPWRCGSSCPVNRTPTSTELASERQVAEAPPPALPPPSSEAITSEPLQIPVDARCRTTRRVKRDTHRGCARCGAGIPTAGCIAAPSACSVAAVASLNLHSKAEPPGRRRRSAFRVTLLPLSPTGSAGMKPAALSETVAVQQERALNRPGSSRSGCRRRSRRRWRARGGRL